MICKSFKPISLCDNCSDVRCNLKGGITEPSEMCGCDYCQFQRVVGDKEECLHNYVNYSPMANSNNNKNKGDKNHV